VGRRRKYFVLRSRTPLERAFDACTNYFGSLVGTLSRRVLITIGVGFTIIILGVVIDSALVRYVGLGLVGVLVLLWVVVGTTEHVREVRDDRRRFRSSFYR